MKKMYLDGVVGWDFDARSVRKALDQLNGESLEVEINSPGGAAYEGFSIFNVLKKYSGSITTVINGMAASAASIIFLAGDQRKALEGSFYMIHNSAGFLMGYANKEALAKLSSRLEKWDAQGESFYRKLTNIADPKQAMKDETFYTTDEMLEEGVISEIVETTKISKEVTDNMNMLGQIKEACAKGLNISAADKPETVVDVVDINEAGIVANVAPAGNQTEPENNPVASVEPQTNATDENQNSNTDMSEIVASIKEMTSTVSKSMEELGESVTATNKEVSELKADVEALKEEKAKSEEQAAETQAAIEAKEKALKEKEEKLNNYFPSDPEGDTQNKWGAF